VWAGPCRVVGSGRLEPVSIVGEPGEGVVKQIDGVIELKGVTVLEQQGDLGDCLVQKIQAAQIHRNPYFKPFAGKDSANEASGLTGRACRRSSRR
jgi:hypothetical protein